MNLLEVYNLYTNNQLTLAEAARTLNTTERGLKQRLTKWGHRFPLLLATLDKLKIDAIGSKEAAELLDVTIREVNYLRDTYLVTRTVKPNQLARTASKIKWEVHKAFTLDYIAGRVTIESVAESTGLSTRQVRRKVAQLLEEHEGITFKDFTKLSLHKRYIMANRIAEAENLNDQKKAIAEAIAAGKQTLEGEAIARVVDIRNKRRSPNVRRRPPLTEV